MIHFDAQSNPDLASGASSSSSARNAMGDMSEGPSILPFWLTKMLQIQLLNKCILTLTFHRRLANFLSRDSPTTAHH